jgi:hypothetical protein
MFFRSDSAHRLDELQDQLRRAQIVTPALMSMVVGSACTRMAMPSSAAKAAHVNRLIESQAWTEAALALVELELPLWRLRRLVFDDGVWLCSLSKQWNLPDWLDESAEAHHQLLPLAILCALIEARQWGEPSSRRSAGTVPQRRPRASSPVENMCCDNFS